MRMESLVCNLEGKLFSALLQGLTKRLFFEEEMYTDEYLAQALFKGLDNDLDKSEMYSQINNFEKVDNFVYAASICSECISTRCWIFSTDFKDFT